MIPQASSHPFIIYGIGPASGFSPSCCSGGLQIPKAINLQSKSMCRAVRGRADPAAICLSFCFFVLKELQSSVFGSDDQNTHALKELCHSSFFPYCSHWRLASLGLRLQEQQSYSVTLVTSGSSIHGSFSPAATTAADPVSALAPPTFCYLPSISLWRVQNAISLCP